LKEACAAGVIADAEVSVLTGFKRVRRSTFLLIFIAPRFFAASNGPELSIVVDRSLEAEFS
jgi:hypothetical protein